MAYSTGPTHVVGDECWLTNSKSAFIFKGDYREHLHLEDPSKKLYRNQSALPPLPVPDLNTSCETYLASVKALATEEEYARTLSHVREFLQPGGMGHKLHQRLLERAEEYGNSSWLQHWWNVGSYLQFRMSNVINVSYFFTFKDLPTGFRNDQVLRAALLTHGALKYRQLVCQGVDVNDRAQFPGCIGPGCATPFKYMFNACRIPLFGSDQSVHYSPEHPNHQHIVVIRKGQFFTFQASEGKDGMWEPFETEWLETQFSAIIRMADSGKAKPHVGCLTGAHRDAFAAARSRMVDSSPSNREFLDVVQSAIFCVCLDDAVPVTRTDTNSALWHGDSCQRWFDKSMQLVIFGNGKAGMVGEHSNYDGQPMVGVANFLLLHERKLIERVNSPSAQSEQKCARNRTSDAPRNISTLLQLSTDSLWDMQNAMAEYQQLVAKHDLSVLPYHGLGSTKIKTFRCSPDAFVQMVIQLAYKRMFGECRATYEPLSMRKFRHGRTETIRTVSTASQAMVSAMDDPNSSAADRALAIQNACSQHSAYTKKAAAGKVCDRHLMGLNMLRKAGEKLPGLFQDPLYLKSKTWHISTSNLSHELFEGWGWGEVVPDGLGVAYSTNKNMLLFNVTSARKFAADFCSFLEIAIRDMVEALEESRSTESKL
jgi:carnitine O-acetyltransferase